MNIFKALLKGMSWQQIVIFVVGTGGVFVIENLIPAGELRTLLLSLDANLVALLTNLFRKPSNQGGSVIK